MRLARLSSFFVVGLFSLLAKAEDPFQFLESTSSPQALQWVAGQNQRTLSILERDPRFSTTEAAAEKIDGSKERLPSPTLQGGWVYDFWQDVTHVKGIWRRVELSGYGASHPAWQTVLDLDALAQREKKDWVWKEALCLPPAYQRCLIQLSLGGKDAAVVREFDVAAGDFVAGGFRVPEGKTDIAWKDENTVLVGTDTGAGSMTSSGYPRTVRRWRRGTPLSEAKLLLDGEATDVELSGKTWIRPEGSVTILTRALTFFSAENSLLGPNGSLTKIPFPVDANLLGVFQNQVIAQLRTEWKTPAGELGAGSVVSLPVAKVGSAEATASVELVWAPDALSAFKSLSTAKDFLCLVVLHDVNAEALEVRREANHWSVQKVTMPERGTIQVEAADDFDSRVILSYQSFLVPKTQFLLEGDQASDAPKTLKTLPAQFEARGLVVEQLKTPSRDGTPIPYYVVRRQDLRYDGNNPTVLYAYGGFEDSLTPFYWGLAGKLWLEKGGVLVVANIRGGGEFGPKWHEAALKQNRQRAYDDFAAVAEALVHRKLTSPRHLGIMGASNGGLLVGVAFTEHPELYHAVDCGVPLLDMLRYPLLGAGASWMAEYGDPSDPRMRAVLAKYSPYQNVKAGVNYPRVFLWTSTADDRVTPAHARKMAAKMEAQGHPVLFYENTDGGHSAGTTIAAQAQLEAMRWVYLYQQLGPLH